MPAPTMDKPFAPSCERNRGPILAVLREHFADRRDSLDGIRQWLDEAALPNTPPPLEIDVCAAWPRQRFDAVFSANTLHIMPWTAVEKMFAGLPGVLADDARLIIYGPFNYGGQFTSASNAAFDARLKETAPHQGIRDFAAVDALARQAGLGLLEDRAMPSNNRCLVWQRAASI